MKVTVVITLATEAGPVRCFANVPVPYAYDPAKVAYKAAQAKRREFSVDSQITAVSIDGEDVTDAVLQLFK